MHLFYTEVKEIIMKVLWQNEIKCTVKYEDNYKHPLRYRLKNNEILFNTSKIELYYSFFQELCEEDVIKLMTYYEIGRYIQYKLGQRESSTTISEISVWENGRKYVPKNLLKCYEKLKYKTKL